MFLLKKLSILMMGLGLFFMTACNDSEENSPPTAAQDTPKATQTTPPPNVDANKNDPLQMVDLDRPIALVNGVPITVQQFNSQLIMADAERRMFSNPDENNPDSEVMDPTLKAEILQAMINMELASQEAEKKGYMATPAEIEKDLAAFKSDYENPANLIAELEESGSNIDEFKDQIAKNLTIKKWHENEFLSEATVTDEEARTFYEANKENMRHGEMVRVSQVFIGVPVGTLTAEKGKAKARAMEVIKSLKSGADFEEIVKKYSNDPAAKENNGNLGWLEKGLSMPLFDDVLFNLDKGSITEEPLESPGGYHIFKIFDKRQAGILPFEEIKPTIVEFLANSKMNQGVQQRVKTLRSAANIEIRDLELKKAVDEYNQINDLAQVNDLPKEQNISEQPAEAAKSNEPAPTDNPNP